MKVIGFCGASGAGKTTLIEGVIAALKSRQRRVSVIKRTHKRFDIDHPGKDSWRHREAGAFEVVIASRHRLARIVELDPPLDATVHQLIADMIEVDWLLVEGFGQSDLPKIEVWRRGLGAEPHYPEDPFVVAVATDQPDALPVATLRPVFMLDQASELVEWLERDAERFDYRPRDHG